MTPYQPVQDSVFKARIPPGRQDASSGWWTPGILNFFGKQTVDVVTATAHHGAR